MLKLLTDEERKKVAHEYALRRGIVILLMLTFVFIIGIIGLMPSYLLSLAREDELIGRTNDSNNNIEKGDGPKLKAWLVETNRRLKLLSPDSKLDKPSLFVEQVLAEKLPGVRLTNLSWVKIKDKIYLSVSGVALDRETLVSFRNGINASGYFSEVALPVSNLAEEKNINFQIRFSPAPTSTPKTTQ